MVITMAKHMNQVACLGFYDWFLWMANRLGINSKHIHQFHKDFIAWLLIATLYPIYVANRNTYFVSQFFSGHLILYPRLLDNIA